nr:MAG TPA_asm: hypothetical protein [Caudoviricetes sp.]
MAFGYVFKYKYSFFRTTTRGGIITRTRCIFSSDPAEVVALYRPGYTGYILIFSIKNNGQINARSYQKNGYITPIQPFKPYIILCSIIHKAH